MRISSRSNKIFPPCASSYLPGRRQSPCGNRKCPGGTFSPKAVTGLSGQAPNGERIYRKFPVFLSKSYITFPDKTKSSLFRLLFSVRVELSSRAVATHLAGIENVPVGHFPEAVTGLSGQAPNGERIYRKFPVFLSNPILLFQIKQKAVFQIAFQCARRVIFPGRRQPSIVTVNELNYCVRNGNRCTLITIDTHYVLIKSAFV